MSGERLRVVRPPGGLVDAHPNGNGHASGNRHANGNGHGAVRHPNGVAAAQASAPARNGTAGTAAGAAPSSGVDMARIEAGVREILAGLGEDVSREGLLDTPSRVARAYRELLAGMREDAGEHLGRVFPQEQSGDDVVMLRNIQFTSLCEHHMLPFTGVAHVAYLPSRGRVTGLSKLARTVDVFARRLQMQERLTGQVADALMEHLDPRGAIVVVEAEHSCLRLRGAKKDDARMVTTAFRGELADDRALRAEVLSLMGVGH